MEGLRYFLPLREGQTYIVFPHPHRQASMRNLAASDRRFDRKLTPVCVHPSFEYFLDCALPRRVEDAQDIPARTVSRLVITLGRRNKARSPD